MAKLLTRAQTALQRIRANAELAGYEAELMADIAGLGEEWFAFVIRADTSELLELAQGQRDEAEILEASCGNEN